MKFKFKYDHKKNPRNEIIGHALNIGLKNCTFGVLGGFYCNNDEWFSDCEIGSPRWNDESIPEITQEEFLNLKSEEK